MRGAPATAKAGAPGPRGIRRRPPRRPWPAVPPGGGDPGAGAREKAFQFQLQRARELAARAATTGDVAVAEEAVEAFLAASRFHPKDPVPLAEAALVALDFGDGASTARLLSGIADIDPSSGAFHFVKGALNLSRGQYRDAMVEFEAAMKGDFKADQAADRYFESMLGFGFELVDYGRFEQALGILTKAVAMKPAHPLVPRAYYHMALAWRRLSTPQEAEKALKLCIEKFPSYAVAYGELGDLWTELSRFDEAIPILDRAVRVDPAYAQGYLLRAVAFTGKGMWKEAEEAFAEYEKRFPPTGNSELQRGLYHQLKGEPEKALRCLRSALARDPTAVRAHLLMSMCYHDLGLEEESAEAKARWLVAEEQVKAHDHEKRRAGAERFGPDEGSGDREKEKEAETPAPPPGDGGHGEGGR